MARGDPGYASVVKSSRAAARPSLHFQAERRLAQPRWCCARCAATRRSRRPAASTSATRRSHGSIGALRCGRRAFACSRQQLKRPRIRRGGKGNVGDPIQITRAPSSRTLRHQRANLALVCGVWRVLLLYRAEQLPLSCITTSRGGQMARRRAEIDECLAIKSAYQAATETRPLISSAVVTPSMFESIILGRLPGEWRS